MKTRTRLHFRTTAIFLLALALTVPARGQSKIPNWAAWQLQWENDAFALFSGSDEHYTNGIRFSWIRNSAKKDNPEWSDKLGRKLCQKTPLCGVRAFPTAIAYGHSIGQNMYTPEDISEPMLIPQDRPYAGYLFYSTQVFVRNDTDVHNWELNRPVQNYFELQIGLLGPESQADWAQTKIHQLEFVNAEIPQGWDNQLDFEPAVQGIYQWRRKFGGRVADVIPHWGGAVGNVAIFADAGATFRLGLNLADFPVLNMSPTAAPVNLGACDWEAYVFAGADGRGVARNAFLDGNLFADSHSVEKENWVYDLRAGFLVRYKKWQLSYTFTRRSEEFSPSFGDDTEHDFGAVAFAYLTTWKPRDPRGRCCPRN